MNWTEDDTADVTVDVCVRPAQLAESFDEHLARLRELEAEGTVDAVDVKCWPGRVPTRSPTTDVVERFRTYRGWARDNEVSIQPPFSVDTVSSEFTGEHRTYLSTPVCCLAVSVGDTIAGVYPHTAGEEHRSIEDAIEALTGGDLVDRDALADRATVDEEVCRECSGDLINVQGIRTCHDCHLADRSQLESRAPLVSR